MKVTCVCAGQYRRGRKYRHTGAVPQRLSQYQAPTTGFEVVISSARQRAALDDAAAALRAGAVTIAAGEPPELAAVELRIALDRLGRVTGETVDEAVLDEVFARFCIGK